MEPFDWEDYREEDGSLNLRRALRGQITISDHVPSFGDADSYLRDCDGFSGGIKSIEIASVALATAIKISLYVSA